MQPGDPSTPRPSMPPSAGGTVASGAKLDKAIQDACKILDAIFKAHLDDDWIRYSLIFVWSQVHYAIEQAGDSTWRNVVEKKMNLILMSRLGATKSVNLSTW